MNALLIKAVVDTAAYHAQSVWGILIAIALIVFFVSCIKSSNKVSNEWRFLHSKKRFSQDSADTAAREAENRLYSEMLNLVIDSSKSAGGQKGNPIVTKRSDEKYVYLASALNRSAKLCLGKYMITPHWLKAWEKRENKHYQSHIEAVRQYLTFADNHPEVRAWFVLYDKIHKCYDWLPFDEAMSRRDINAPEKMKNLYFGYQMLAMHLMQGVNDRTAWQSLQCIQDKPQLEKAGLEKQYSDYRLVPVVDNLFLLQRSGATLLRLVNMQPVGMQIYENTVDAKAAAKMQMPGFKEIIKLAAKKVSKMPKTKEEVLAKKIEAKESPVYDSINEKLNADFRKAAKSAVRPEYKEAQKEKHKKR